MSTKAVAEPKAATPAPKSFTPARSLVVQRKCACGGSGRSNGECEECKKKGMLQRRAANGHSLSSVPPIVHDVLSTPGRPLDSATRSFMEPRFGHDFSQVRVHDDARAGESARTVNANAYTVGGHIAFAPGRYDPASSTGRRLLAHELAHTIQQADKTVVQSKSGIDPHDSPAEREADAVADRIMLGGFALIRQRNNEVSLQRQADSLTCADILLAPEAPEGERVPGTVAHDAITADFLRQAKAHAIDIAIPGATSQPVRSGGCEMDELKGKRRIGRERIVLSEQGEEIPGMGGGITEGGARAYGYADLAYRNNRTIELAEIKIGTQECFGLADDQVQRYIDQAKSEDLEPRWKKRRIDDFVRMPPSRYKPTSPLAVKHKGKNIRIAVAWCTDGVIVYKPLALESLVKVSGEAYQLSIGGQSITLNVLPAPSDTDLLNSGPQNKLIAESVPGVILKTLHRKKGGKDTIDAEIETADNSKSGHKSTVPLQTAKEKVPVVYLVDDKTRKLTLKSKKTKIPVEYHRLSKGTITELNYDDEAGLSGKGTIEPSIPLLKGFNLGFAFAQDSLNVTVKLPKKLDVPIPGFEVTDFGFSLQLLPEFKPEGHIGFIIGRGKRALMTGKLMISADEEGLVATGDVLAHVPGLDEATGHVIYRPSKGWSGAFTITTTKIRFVRNASVTVSLSDKGLDLDGSLSIALPGDNEALLNVKKRSATSWIYAGRGKVHVPRLKPVTFDVVYDGETVSGTGSTAFEFKGIHGNIALTYRNGHVTGEASLEINKSNGRLKGSLNVKLNERHKFTGAGAVGYEIKPGLIASAGIIIDDNEKVTVVGSLSFPPYKLFDQHPKPPKAHKLFGFGPKNIPVPFLSFGPVGLEARIGAGIFVSYGIGPGMITGGFIKAKVDPLEDDPDPEFELGGKLSIPAFFSVTGYVSGGLVLDLLVVEAGGKLIVSATAELNGEAGAKFWAKYAKGEFKAEADIKLILELILKFCVDAHVWASAGVWRFKVTTGKSWHLLGYEYRPGLRLGIDGLKKPISYSSNTGFDLPSLDDINWVTPSLDAKHALKSGIDAAGDVPESEGKPKPNPCPGPVITDED